MLALHNVILIFIIYTIYSSEMNKIKISDSNESTDNWMKYIVFCIDKMQWKLIAYDLIIVFHFSDFWPHVAVQATGVYAWIKIHKFSVYEICKRKYRMWGQLINNNN